MQKSAIKRMEQSSAFEDRLRFEIQNNTTEWRNIKEKLDLMRKSRKLPDGIVICLARMRKSTLAHFKYDPETSDSFPLLLVPPTTTITEIQIMIREELGITNSTGLSVAMGDKMLVPSVRVGELRLDYDQLLFLNYTQSDPF